MKYFAEKSKQSVSCALPIALLICFLAVKSHGQPTIVPYTFSTIAGAGQGTAQFNLPWGVAADTEGNLYVADSGDNLIWKMTRSGTSWSATILAGESGVSGTNDSPNGLSATFDWPSGIAVDKDGLIFVCDSSNNVIREITPQGAVTTLAGNSSLMSFRSRVGGYQDGPGGEAEFDLPVGIAVDRFDNVYVADYNNNVIRIVTPPTAPGGKWNVGTFAGNTNPANPGGPNGPALSAQFYYPYGVAVDQAGNVYVADTQDNEIRKITTTDGPAMVSTVAGTAPSISDVLNIYYNGIAFGNLDSAIGPNAQFFFPYGLTVDGAGNIYVADTYNNEIRKISPQEAVTTLGGQASFVPDSVPPFPAGSFANGFGSNARFNSPIGLAVDKQGNLYVADAGNGAIRMGVAPQVKVVGIEVTQAVQDWDNSIPLVEGKDTYVRCHMQALTPEAAERGIPITGAQLYGNDEAGNALPGSPINPINPIKALGASLLVANNDAASPTERSDFSASLNFRLPPKWLTGEVTLQLAWGGGLEPTNGVADDCSVTVDFEPEAVPQIRFIDVIWVDPTGTVHQMGDSILDWPPIVRTDYPVSNLYVTYDKLRLPGTYAPAFTNADNVLVFEKTVLDALKVKRATDVAAQLPVGNQLYHGLISATGYITPSGTPAPTPNSGLSPGPGAPGQITYYSCSVDSEFYGSGRQDISHEIGHNLGRGHDTPNPPFTTETLGAFTYAGGPCGERGFLANATFPPDYPLPWFQPFDGYPMGGAPTLGPMTEGDNSLIYGLDSETAKLNVPDLSPVICPTNAGGQFAFDLMSYCPSQGPYFPEGDWPSSVTYKALMDSINSLFGEAPTPTRKRKPLLANNLRIPTPHRPGTPLPQGGPENFLMVRGMVNFTSGTAQFLPSILLTTTNPIPSELPGSTFVVTAFDASGAVLETNPFDLEPATFEGVLQSNDVLTTTFAVEIAADPALHSLQLSSGGTVLATMTASANAPTLALTSPKGGETFKTNAITIDWSGSDADGDTLTYTVQYSADDGMSWRTMAVDWTNESITVTGSELEASTEGLIRVLASDGINTAAAQSAATFTVLPHPPSVTISAPASGSIFFGGQQLFLDATAEDPQDGLLTGTNVRWQSNRDGALGSGTVLSLNPLNLSEGTHVIMATATDEEGLTASAVTHITVLHLLPPQLSLQVTSGLPEFNIPAAGTLSWPFYYTNYVLQSASSPAAAWTTVTDNPPEISGNQYTVNVSVTNKISFFRLLMQP